VSGFAAAAVATGKRVGVLTERLPTERVAHLARPHWASILKSSKVLSLKEFSLVG